MVLGSLDISLVFKYHVWKIKNKIESCFKVILPRPARDALSMLQRHLFFSVAPKLLTTYIPHPGWTIVKKV